MSAKQFIVDLRRASWRTMGARFNASRRLRRRDVFGTVSIAVFATISVVLAIIQRIYEFKAGTALDNYVTALSVALGFFVVIISLIEWGSAGPVKAEALYRNAEELTEYQRKLGQILSDEEIINTEMLTPLREEYEQIKRRCSFNHEPVDDALFRADHRSDFKAADGRMDMGRIECVWTHVKFQASAVLYFGVLWLAVFGLLWQTPWADLANKKSIPEKHASP